MSEIWKRVSQGINRRISGLHDYRKVAAAFKLVHGPARVTLAEDEAGLVILVRDAAWFLPSFLAHHFALGVSHVVVVDNGSTDDTAAIARRHSNVTVLSNPLPAKQYEVRLRAMAAQRVYRGGWTMFADADELVEVPGGLQQMLRYAGTQGFTAVVGQMLDLCAPGDQRVMEGLDYASAVAACTNWTMEGLKRHDYHDAGGVEFYWLLKDNVCSDPQVRLLSGGLRKTVFGEDPFLSKHTLVRNAPNVYPMTHPHCASGVVVADVTLCLRHYKLAGDWRRRDRASVAAASWDHADDVRRVRAASSDEFELKVPMPLVWEGLSQLLDKGLLYASPKARTALSLS